MTASAHPVVPPAAARATATAVVAVVVVVGLGLVATPAGAVHDRARAPDGEAAAGELLSRARDATAVPHSGRVTVVSFTDAGPRVAAVEVVVADDGAVLRTPARVLVDPVDATSGLAAPPSHQRVLTSPLGLDVDAVLTRWAATVGDPVELDTGLAVPVELVRRAGAPVRETLFLDEATGIPVRRETRDPDGRALRVVAYTELEVPGPADVPEPSGRVLAARTDMVEGLVAARAAGFDVPQVLDGGFALLTVEVADEPDGSSMAVARYSDGLSVLSVYQQHGTLDPDALEGAVVEHVADRDVWRWPGREPARTVWTGDDRTWTAVSDAPPQVVDEALASLPGDLVGHDAPHRLRRGLDRVWRFVTAPLR